MSLTKKETLDSKIKCACKEWIKDSTSHGFPRIFKTNRVMLKILWIFFVLLSTATCAFIITKAVMDYLDFNVTTKLRLVSQIPIVFPVVTICNANPFVTNSSRIFVQQLLGKYNVTNILENLEWYRYLFLVNAANPNLDLSIKKSFGLSLDDLIISCSFNGFKCEPEEFEWFYTTYFGNCFKFNSGNRTELKKTNRPDLINGLKLELFVGYTEDTEYSFDEISGVQLGLHDQSYIPPYFNGIKAPTGARTDIAIYKTHIKQLEQPYSDCVKDLSKFDSYLYKLTLNQSKIYSRTACYDLCFQQVLIRKCDCYDATITGWPNAKQCITKEDIFCSGEIFFNFFQKKTRSMSVQNFVLWNVKEFYLKQ